MRHRVSRQVLRLAASLCERWNSARANSRLSIGVLSAALAFTSGCQSTLQRPCASCGGKTTAALQAEGWSTKTVRASSAPSGNVLQPQSVVYWSALPGSGTSTRGYQGRSTVQPDGSIALGEYGSVHVAGLTPEQARTAVTKQIAHHIKDPRVSLSLSPPAQESEAVARREDPRNGSNVVRTGHTVTAGPSLGDNTAPPAEQRIAFTGHRDDQPSTVEPPPASTELPFPGHVVIPAHGPQMGSPGHAPNELNMMPLPPYVIGVTDILLIETKKTLEGKQPIGGQHLVNPDGTVRLGVYGSVRVAGLTLEQARQVITDYLTTLPNVGFKLEASQLNVDILAYNSKKYYVVTDGGGYGEQVYSFPVTGNDFVLDALGLIGGLPPVSSKTHIWVARRNAGNGYGNILPVDWIGITQRGAPQTNYQIMPGDRIYVQADHWRRFDSNVQKVLSPFERILGATLLGASTVQTIRGNQGGVGGGGR